MGFEPTTFRSALRHWSWKQN